MTTPVPLETFAPDLLPGETIVWTGRPNPSIVFHDEDWAAIPFSLLWGGFAIFWLIEASGIGTSWTTTAHQPIRWFGVIWGTPFVVIGQYMIWGRFVYQRWVKQRSYYALTNRRALIVSRGLTRRSCTSAYFDSLTLIDRRVRSDGIGSIAFGDLVRGQWQWGRNRAPRPFTFDDLDDAESVYHIVIRLQDQVRRAVLATT